MNNPDYERSLVGISNSVLRAFGAPVRHKTLPVLDGYLGKGYRNVVMMLFDGMGIAALEDHLPEDGFLRGHWKESISSVFPPTTTAALTSFETGLTPMEHGWLGWSLYFKELDQIIELFPNTVRDSGGVQAAEYHVASRMMPHDSIADAIGAAGIGVMHTVSPYGGHRVTRQVELFETVRRLCAEPGSKFVYAYWNQPDALMHETGCDSERVRETVRGIDQSVEALCATLEDTLLVVTADHGHINTRYRFISDYPDLANAILRPPAIEGRAAAFYVKDSSRRGFPDLFHGVFGDSFLLWPRDEVIRRGIFGTGNRHPRFVESIGDYLAVAVGDVAIANNRQTRQFVSNHGGLTRQEMAVPLILIET